MTSAIWQPPGPTKNRPLAEYEFDQYGPLFAVSDEGSAGPVVVDAARSSPKAVAGLSGPLQLGVILDGERMTSAGETPIGPPEYNSLSAAAAGRLLLTTNVGTRVNVRLTGQLPEFPALESSAQAVIAAFQSFLETPDRRPRPLTVRLRIGPRPDFTQLVAIVGKLNEARKKGQIGPSGVHQLSVLVAFTEEIGTDEHLEQIEEVIAAAAELAVAEVAIDGEELAYARQRFGGQGLLNVVSISALTRLLKFAAMHGVTLKPRYQVDVDSAARTVWTGLEAARMGGFDAGKYGLLPLTLEEQVRVIELITRWTTGWTAIPAFYVDTPLVTATEVFEVAQCEAAARRWLKAARGAGATTVLFDAPDRVNPRKLVKGSDSPDGVLTIDQIASLKDYGEVLGVKIMWSGGITAPQAYELAQRGVFAIFSTSSTATKMAVTTQFRQDPRLAAENEPTEIGVRRMHAIIQGGFLATRIREADPGLAHELETSTTRVINAGMNTKSETAIAALNDLLVRGWRRLRGDPETNGMSYQVGQVNGVPCPVPADAVRVFRGRNRAGTPRRAFVQRLEEVFMPMTVQMQRLYGLTAYLPAVLPEVSGSAVPDEVALVFYRTQESYHEAKRCIGGRAYSDMHELAFDMSRSKSEFPRLLETDVLKPDQAYHLFEQSVDWQSGVSRLYVGTRKTGVQAEAFLAEVGKIARRVQAAALVDAAIFSANGDWLVWWDHAPAQPGDSVQHFESIADVRYVSASRRLRIPESLTEPYAGLSLDPDGDFINFLFTRP